MSAPLFSAQPATLHRSEARSQRPGEEPVEVFILIPCDGVGRQQVQSGGELCPLVRKVMNLRQERGGENALGGVRRERHQGC